MVDITVCTLNVRNTPDLPRPQVRHDLAAVRARAGVHLWQEIAEADDRADLEATLGKGWTHTGLGTENPISVNRNFELIEHGRRLMHKGLDHVSPNRYATYAIVRRGRLEPFAIVNTHTVSRPFDDSADHRVWRRTMWEKHHDRLSVLVTELLAEGYSTLIGGDFNASHVPALHPGQRNIMSSRLDHLMWVNATGGVRLARVKRRHTVTTAELFTDHPALVARLALT